MQLSLKNLGILSASISLLTALLSAQTNVASKESGASIEVISGKAHAKEDAERLIDGNPKSRAVFFPPEEAAFRIRFFKEMDIDRVKLLKSGDDSTYTVKDILIKTSSGKEIPVTLPQEGYSHRNKKATPEFVTVDVNDNCEYIDIIVQSAYKTGKEYTAMYEIMAETSEDISKFLEVNYNAELPRYIMRTKFEPEPVDESTIDSSKVVNGQPVKLGPNVFPKTIFSPADIQYYQEQIRTNPQAQKAYAELLEACDGFMKKSVDIPTPEDNKAADTNKHTRYSEWIGSLAFAHVLSGNQKPEYAQRAIELMKYYADNYAEYGPTKHPKFSHDTAKITWQRLSEAMWGISVVWGYDLLMSDPDVFSKEDAQYIADNLLIPVAVEIKRGSGTVLDPATNWSAYPAVYMMMVGRVIGDETWVDLGMYGSKGEPTATVVKEKNGKITSKTPGLTNKIRDGIDAQGNWAEPSPGYMQMAAAAMIAGARVAWNNGDDWYSYGEGNLRRLRESELIRATDNNYIPGTEDGSGRFVKENFYTALDEHLNLVYQDNAVLQNKLASRKNFTLKIRFQTILPSIDFQTYSAAESEPLDSIYLPSLGYTIARQDYDDNPLYFLFDASVEASHGHPDKLQILLHAHDEMVLPDSGMTWYANPEYGSWYKRTGTHNTVSINESDMSLKPPVLEVFASADKMHLVRATAPKAYPGTILNRTTLQLDTILLDVFNVDTQLEGDIDYNFHFRGGELVQSPKGEPGTYFTKDPFQQLSDQKKLDVGKNATFVWDYEGDRQLHYQTVTSGSEVFFGEGITPKENPDDFVIVRRRQGGQFFSAIDASIGDSRVEQLEQIPSGDKDLFIGKITYTDGATGKVLVNYASDITAASLGNNASIQGYFAYIEQNASGQLVKFVYAGEGGQVSINDITVDVSGPGIVMIDQFTNNYFTARNLNNREGEPQVNVTIDLPLKSNFVIHKTDEDGHRTGTTTPIEQAEDGRWVIAINGDNRQEITDSKQSVYQIESAKRKTLVQAALVQERQQREAAISTLKDLYANADKQTPNSAIVLAQAEAFDRETVGEANRHKGRPGAFSEPGSDAAYIMAWTTEGHELSYDIEVPESGYYALSLKYCSAEQPKRSIKIDGEYPADFFRQIEFNSTGGWSRDADNWELTTVSDPSFGIPWLIYLDKGKHTVSIEQIGDGMNLDYIVLHDYTISADKVGIEKGNTTRANMPNFDELQALYLE